MKMKRKAVGFFTGLVNGIHVRSANDAKNGPGRVSQTIHASLFAQIRRSRPNFQLLSPKLGGHAIAIVVEVIPDSVLEIKYEFGGEGNSRERRERMASISRRDCM
ncbi:hypothetical protein PM082_009080 [Marasmius tenuissimus]|nr:hypothetical protein PM082_009080 [Marasmius tenuissimus]